MLMQKLPGGVYLVLFVLIDLDNPLSNSMKQEDVTLIPAESVSDAVILIAARNIA